MGDLRTFNSPKKAHAIVHPVPQISADPLIFRNIFAEICMRSIGTTFPHHIKGIKIKKKWMRRITPSFSTVCGIPIISCGVLLIFQTLWSSTWSGKRVPILRINWNLMHISALMWSIGTPFCINFQLSAEIQCRIPHAVRNSVVWNSVWSRAPHDAEFCMMRNSTQCVIPHEMKP